MPCFSVHGWWVKDKNLSYCLSLTYLLVDWFMAEWPFFGPSNERVPLWLDFLKLWFISAFLIAWTWAHLCIFIDILCIVNDKPLSWMIVSWRSKLLISMTSMCGFYWLLWKFCSFIFCHLSLWSSVCASLVNQEPNRQSSLWCLKTYRFKCPTFLCMDDEWRINSYVAIYPLLISTFSSYD